MKNLFVTLILSSLAAANSFAGTTINYSLPLNNSADFAVADASNFRIDSVVLTKTAVEVTKTTDEACEATAETPTDCSSYSYEFKNVVQVTLSFDSDAGQYSDGGNYVQLVLAQDTFSAQELAAIKNDAWNKGNLIKLKSSLITVTEPVVDNENSTCLDSESACSLAYVNTEVQKLHVEISK